MATVSDKEVEKARDKVEKLRQQVQDTRQEIDQAEAARNNAVSKARYEREAEALESQLAALKEQAKVSKSPVENDAVMEPLTPEVVDTTPDDDQKEKK